MSIEDDTRHTLTGRYIETAQMHFFRNRKFKKYNHGQLRRVANRLLFLLSIFEIAPWSTDRRPIERFENKLFVDDTIYARIDIPNSFLQHASQIMLGLDECDLYYPQQEQSYAILQYGCALYPFVQVDVSSKMLKIQLYFRLLKLATRMPWNSS